MKMEYGDMLLHGSIFTGRRHVGAIVIGNGRVLFAGDLSDAQNGWKCARTLYTGNGTVVPGLIDSHVHLAATGMNMLSSDLRGSRSAAEIAMKAGKMVSEKGFAVASGWDQELFEGGRYPSAADLDAVSSEGPMILYRYCSHVAVVNSHVIERAGVTAETPDPPGGIIGRDSSGRPDGMFFDTAIERYIYPIEEELTRGQVDGAVRRTVEYAISRGLTTLVAMNADPAELSAVNSLEKRGELKCRVRFFLSKDAFLATGVKRPEINEDEMVKVCGVKLFADGSFGGRTALLSSPYSDKDTSGLQLTTDDEIEQLMREAVKRKMIVAVHAIGDRAAENVLRSASKTGIPSKYLRIEHAAYTPHAVLEMLSRIRPALAVQPHFLVGDWWLGKRLGVRIRDCYLFRTCMEMGLVVAGSSDSPVEPLDPWTGILTAMDRGRHAGVEIAETTAGEALDADSALTMYTTNGGAACGEAEVLGTLEPGAYADAVFLEEGSIDIKTASSPTVIGTMVGGKFVYTSGGNSGDRLSG